MIKRKLAITGIAALLVTLGITNPTETEHQEKIASVMSSLVGDGDLENVVYKFAPSVGSGSGMTQQQTQIMLDAFNAVYNAFAEATVDGAVEVKDYILCSVGEINLESLGLEQMEDSDQVVSVGILGHVFTIDKEDILNLLANSEITNN